MSVMLLACGTAVLAVVTLDIMMTTVGTATRLTLSDKLAYGTFRLLRLASRLGGARLITQVAGVVVMFAIFVVWVGGTWIGWTLVFAAFPGAVEMTETGALPEAADVAGHAGHLLSTLGGDVTQAGGPEWNVLATLVGVNGMVVLPLGVSFLLSTRQTVRDARAFAALEAEEAMPPDALAGRLADVIAGLDASPFALWYGHTRPSRRLPDALVSYARRAEAAGGGTARLARRLLADLPHLDPPEPVGRISARAWLGVLEEWAARHQLHERQGGGDAPRDARDAASREAGPAAGR